jgi:hypothetical protein
MTTRFTILLPVTRPPVFLPSAIDSALAQTIGEFELFVICDGAAPETVECAQSYARRDARVRVFSFPKGEMSGEAHWHGALKNATGTYVAHIEDDDLWFPNHLEELEKLLDTVDFGHLIHVWVKADGQIEGLISNIGHPEFRRRLVEQRFNSFGISVCGYRLDAYRCLPEGWSPSPPQFPPDLFMWRKFFQAPGLRFGTRMAVTALGMPSFMRRELTLEERRDEELRWLRRVLNPVARGEIIEQAWLSIVDKALYSGNEVNALGQSLTEARAELELMTSSRIELQAELDQLRAGLERIIHSRSWRLTKPLRTVLATAKRAGRALRRQVDS